MCNIMLWRGEVYLHGTKTLADFILTINLLVCRVVGVMKLAKDTELIRSLGPGQRGVFSKGDLQGALGERHPAAFFRRVNALVKRGVLRRFARGWYVSDQVDLSVLSQRIAPQSYISMESVLSEALMAGVSPELNVTAVKTGPSRVYEGCGLRVTHLGVKPALVFGFSTTGGVRRADAEKATLDTLYFHLRGRRYPFDVFSDIDYSVLNREKLRGYLKAYENPKFVAFVKGLVDL